MDWWLTQPGRVPIGPVSTDVLLERIRAGNLPEDVLVCEVGDTTWKSLRDVPVFRTERFDPEAERKVLDEKSVPPSEPPSDRIDTIPVRRDAGNRKVADPSPLELRRSAREALYGVDEVEDKTVVDAFPPFPSEPPQ